MTRKVFELRMDGGPLVLGRRTLVMGVVNVTPDSFSDGGDFFEAETAIAQGVRLAEEGADLLDIGGESTRPFSEPISAGEELRRVMPVIEALVEKVEVPISIDTSKAKVAEKALDAGARMVNDVTALRADEGLARVAADRDVPLVIMHMLDRPKTMQESPAYRSLISEIIAFLEARLLFAREKGVDPGQVIVDPGIGFGKTFEHNLSIINNLELFRSLERPVMIGPSRKAFLGAVLGKNDPKERETGSAAAAVASIMHGAHIVRMHSAALAREAARVTDSICREKVDPD